MTHIRTHQDLVNCIATLVHYNYADEYHDLNEWKQANPGMEDSQHIFHVLEALDSWANGGE